MEPEGVAVRFHRLAAQEYLAARRWYEGRSEGLGATFAAEVDRAVLRISDQPDRWPLYRHHFRRVRLRRFPYLLFYRVESPALVFVLAVAHARRREGYWIRRAARP